MNLPLIKPTIVDIFAVQKDKNSARYLLIQRTNNGIWQMPGGKVNGGETAWQAALRELKEETGLHAQQLYSVDMLNTFYYVKTDAIMLVPVFLAIVEGGNTVMLSEEHTAFEWVTYEQATKLLAYHNEIKILQMIHEQFILKKPNELLRINI